MNTALLTGRLLSASTVEGTISTAAEVVDISVIRDDGDVCVKPKLVVMGVAEGREDAGPKPCDVAAVIVSDFIVSDFIVSACPGRRTSGAAVLNEFKATKGMSTPLNVAVERMPEDVKVTVSRLTDVTRLDSGPIVSMFPTKLSICKPGLIAKIMLSSQWGTGSIW